MSIAAQTASAVVRSCVIAGASLSLGFPLARLLAAVLGNRRAGVWALLLAPMLTPALLVSYAYSQFALRLIASPNWGWICYSAALFLKLAPIAALTIHFVPPALSPEAAHAFSLLGKSRWEAWKFRVRGAGRAPWLAAGLVFLLAFCDFEMASLWNLKTWTVSLFDAQAGGLAIGESLRLAALPLCAQIAALTLVFVGGRRSPDSAAGRWQKPGSASRRSLAAYLIFAALAGCAVPSLIVGAQAISGVASILENFVLGKDLAASLCFSIGATACVWPLSGWIVRSPNPRFAFCLPGLLGALQLSLLILAAFQIPALHAVYDSPLPLLAALILLLLPFAAALRLLLDADRRAPGLHIARLCGSGELLWTLDFRRRWLAGQNALA